MTWSRLASAALVAAGLLVASNAQAVESYLVVFDSSWSADNHPADFPPNPHYSGLVGGSHNSSIVFWEAGGLASPGIKRMAETGSKSIMLEEVNDAIDAGTAEFEISGPGMSLSPGSVNHFVDVSEDFSLVTIVSMIAPSPDWFIGVNGLDLQDGSGNWLNDVTVPLSAWDAGTDSGTTYTSSNLPTVPAVPIADITADYPFFGETVGTLRFIRQTVGVGDAAASTFQMSAAQPNPTRLASSVTLTLANESTVTADVFDVNGRRVRALVNGQLSDGIHTLTWDGRTQSSVTATPGVYFIRLNVDGNVQTNRLTLLR